MAEKIRIAGKVLLIIVCTVCLIYLIHKDEKVFQLKQPEGELITTEDVLILIDAMTGGTQNATDIFALNQEELYLSYGNYITFLEALGEMEREELLYQGKYREEFYLLKEDWYQAYDTILEIYGLEEVICRKDISVLTGNENLPGEKLGDECVLTATGKIYRYRSHAFEQCNFQSVNAYVKEDTLLTIREKTDDNVSLNNVWIMEKDNQKIQFFYMGFEIVYGRNSAVDEELVRESIADLTFGNGSMIEGSLKNERISGRLLRLSETELELEGEGTFPIASECKVYKLYEELQEQGLDELQLGYDFADYVLSDGEVCAVLILRKENMESIRVAIRNNQFASLYHEEIKVVADCDMEMTYGYYDERKTEIIKAGETISFYEENDYLKGDRVILKPLVLSGKIQVLSLDRNQGSPSYRGNLQISALNEGMVLVNEVLLEEYLYSVVPSEMPALYPEEALKAQAICARTYAYQYLTTPGLGSIGANVDDSVGYQVYNNIAENVNSTKAVKETTGQLLFYESEPVNTYYYSTSCGFGTDAGVWQESNVTKYPYLSSVHINNQEETTDEAYSGTDMQQEDTIREYLFYGGEGDYEHEEPWYRWSYFVEELEASVLYERLYSRFRADDTKILKLIRQQETERGDFFKGNETLPDEDAFIGEYESIEPEKFEEVYDIVCIKRREGGVMDELILNTDSGVYKIISEYNIRYILNNGGNVTRQDNSEAACGQLLPSAYMVIDTVKEKDIVTGYEIIGGGYGHGVGMSQNGAKKMAEAGMNSNEIITFFYPGCELKKLY